MPKVLFKEVESATEIEQIHALNHRIFAEEIAQHHRQPSGLLVDRFHLQNKYFIAVLDGTVAGMISAHGGPEFSVTKRLPDPAILQRFALPLEVRLLAIDPRLRNRTVLAGLLWQVYDFGVSHGFSHLLISGIAQRERMYRKLGFSALGPAVPEGSASFIPMVMAIGRYAKGNENRIRLHERHWKRSVRVGDEREPVSLMPGPVCIHPRVARAWASPPVSHRSPAFTEKYEEVRSGLNGLVGGTGLEVTLFPGAGTLANDAVAANLKALFGREEGLVLTNGEFGERIAKQAASAGLRFRKLSFPWGEPWRFATIENALDRKPAWIWAVHLETSTGVLNDIERLQRLADDASCAVALDCVSSLGATPVANETGNLLLASGVSGKAIGSYAGLAFVYLGGECRRLLSDAVLCPSFDLLHMHQTYGPVTTVPSSLLFALARALEIQYGSPEAVAERFREYRALGEQTRRALRAAGLEPLAAEDIAAPTITTFALPSPGFPEQCLEAGYQIAHESSYLQQRGWGQIATMGNVTPASLAPLFEAIASMGMGQAAHA
ncbi:MAG: aminotransferase class V-fold PLP-dependent enzyme [Silvibacterium sp.]